MEKENEKIFWQGFNIGKQSVIKKILSFVDKESEFIPDIHTDMLLDRLIKFIKKI